MPGSLRFFFDENLLPVGTALSAVRDDVVFPGHPGFSEVMKGAKDIAWLPVVGKTGLDLVVITQDKNIRKKPGELTLLKNHGVRMFVLAPKRDLGRWDKLTMVVKFWDRLEKTISRSGDGPWVFSVTEAKITLIPFP